MTRPDYLRMRRLAVLAITVLASTPAVAGSPGAPLTQSDWPLSSVGKLNVVTGAGRRTECTGTLVTPTRVLTAGHCLFDKVRQVWVHPSSIHFVAGYSRGEFRAHAVASGYVTGHAGAPPNQARPEAAARDWALVDLAGTIDLRPVPVRADLRPGVALANLARAGYRGDRAHVLTLQQPCSAKPMGGPHALLADSCASVQGQSGSALLSFEGGAPEVVGVLVANGRVGDAPLSVVVPSPSFAAALGSGPAQ